MVVLPSGLRQRLYLLVMVLVFSVAGYGVYHFATQQGSLPVGLIQANGRIEGDAITIASKVAGRIVAIDVLEGQAVKAGQLLVRLDDAQLRSRVEQASAAVATLESQVASARLGIELMKKEMPLAVDSARAGLSRAEAAAATAEVAERQAQRDAQRASELVEKGFSSDQQSERAQLALAAAQSERRGAREAATQASKQLAQAELGAERIKVRESELRTLQAQERQTRASLVEAESVLSDLTIRAPVPGVIVSRMREPGEVITAGTPLLELLDLGQLYLKVYVPESQIGQIRLGLPAQVHTDAYPGQPYDAEIRYISARAEFTPKEVQTPDERVKLVYAVKLYFKSNPEHRLSPGLPADAVIRWKDDVAWQKPRW